MSDDIDKENEQISQRRDKLAEWREQSLAFPNDFRRDVVAGELHAHYDDKDNEFFEANPKRVRAAGRLMLKRNMGKTTFAHIQDYSGKIQVMAKKDKLGEENYAEFKKLDIGDIIGIEGLLFKTKTNELTIVLEEYKLLTKAIRPLPEKFQGVKDQEIKYRQRYLDLIMNEVSRNCFHSRTKIINRIRHCLNDADYMEVETPMMQVVPGGALAKPFVTHHNALDMKLFLRIAPELYLKRLVVGGFERVFEINRNFRNEGISVRHNPEFTMLEAYQAYADYTDMMNLTEELLRAAAHEVSEDGKVEYDGKQLDFDQSFRRLNINQAIVEYNQEITLEQLEDMSQVTALAKSLDIEVKSSFGIGKIQLEIFEKTVEKKLIEPTFIVDYPAEVSPLARRNDSNPEVTDRFELFISGYEIANGFSELNDPEDQAERFRLQLKDRELGDEEAMHFDNDYIKALEHGMPPTAGVGIGIDRLVMLLTNSASIRDVLLFPYMRPEA